jgi:hypothetical protein
MRWRLNLRKPAGLSDAHCLPAQALRVQALPA